MARFIPSLSQSILPPSLIALREYAGPLSNKRKTKIPLIYLEKMESRHQEKSQTKSPPLSNAEAKPRRTMMG